MRRVAAAAIVVAVSLAGVAPASAAPRRHHRRCHRDCDDRDGEDGRQVCFAFCDDVIVIPGLPGQDQPQPKGIACLVPAPFHCDQPGRTASLITDPKKIVEFPVTVVEMSLTFAQSILKLVV